MKKKKKPIKVIEKQNMRNVSTFFRTRKFLFLKG